MSTTPTAPLSLRAIVAEVYAEGQSTREIAEAAAAAAGEHENHEAMIRGWMDAARTYTREQWRSRSTRSGRNNESGRLAGAAILRRTIRTNDGAAYVVGDVTADVASTLADEYAVRARDEAAGRDFWQWAADAMQEAGVERLADLGEEVVEAERERLSYRV